MPSFSDAIMYHAKGWRAKDYLGIELLKRVRSGRRRNSNRTEMEIAAGLESGRTTMAKSTENE